MKLVCCYCIITYKNHNPTTLHDKDVIKLKRNIDIDGITSQTMSRTDSHLSDYLLQVLSNRFIFTGCLQEENRASLLRLW